MMLKGLLHGVFHLPLICADALVPPGWQSALGHSAVSRRIHDQRLALVDATPISY
jgi:hypothetical protein